MISNYFKRLKKSPAKNVDGDFTDIEVNQTPLEEEAPQQRQQHLVKEAQPLIEVFNLDELETDPGLRIPINELFCTDKQKEEVRRAYLLKGPYQLKDHNFPFTLFGDKKHRFTSEWYKEGSRWMEYSVAKDAIFCLNCYIFKPDYGDQAGSEVFVNKGYNNWKDKANVKKHVDDHSSTHNQCHAKCVDLMNQRQHIDVNLACMSKKSKLDYRISLNASIEIDCIRFLLHQGLAFRGHDESVESENQGNFMELLKFLSNHNDDIKKAVLENAPKNHQMTAPKIQRQLTSVCAYLMTKKIIAEIVRDKQLFSLLVDESRDVAVKEQMAIVFCYVDKIGCVIEHFIGIVHVKNTSAKFLKIAIDAFFVKYGLSLTSLRGQGYDGASNMRVEFNSLKTLILRESKFAFYIHCFSHQLQLALVKVVSKHLALGEFFQTLSMLSNTIAASCKRRDLLRDKQYEYVISLISNGDILTGRGLNQECTIKRPGDTR
ncbi:zinc finger MYM-type protein 1-like [Pistacia vera]|uniref:zinc finger MYM-type protein 1-like n=1 Tax=Pistacia vera TaxID=55513 RepID=UPI0012638446|nr:zinc finger MYM-type protein 1-like [Pistacia vera]